MNFDVVFDNLDLFWRGAVSTFTIAFVTSVLSVAAALPLAVMRDMRSPFLSWPAAAFSWVSRATPALALLFFAYYGLPGIGIYLAPVPAAILGLSLSAAGYNMEFIRAGLQAVPRTQYDAARALGIPYRAALRRIIIPQAMRVIVPPLASNLTLVIKGSALASLVAVSELTGEAMALISFTYKPFEILITVAAIYLAINSALISFQHYLERRFRFG